MKGHLFKLLHNSRGLTLLEIMLSVSLFALLILYLSQMTTASTRMTADNVTQTQMMELARAEAEYIKAGEPAASYPRTIDFPPGGPVEKRLSVNVAQTDNVLNYTPGNITGTMLKITVCPEETFNAGNPDNYVLAAWIPF